MDIKELLTSFAQITVFAVMLSMGMVLRFEGMARLWRRPSLLLRCVIAAFVVVPLAAMAVVHVLPLSFEVRAGIATMAVIPGAPTTYRKILKGSGNPEPDDDSALLQLQLRPGLICHYLTCHHGKLAA